MKRLILFALLAFVAGRILGARAMRRHLNSQEVSHVS